MKSQPGTDRQRRWRSMWGVIVFIAFTLVVAACDDTTDTGTASRPLISPSDTLDLEFEEHQVR
ncbi:MAG: hypothetical protein ACE1Y9_03595 [Acidimicrobiia bacterium]